ncbi:MAG: hypothetical protein M3256_26055 [Actinomycetota bacterium]|nr:hypothetical protein [Actinomycetota bacterium]
MVEDLQRNFELRIEPGTSRFDPDDDRWRAQVSQLYSGLGDEVGGIRRNHVSVPGAKGEISNVILSLGSAGAFTAMAEYLRAWLGRDKNRSLDVSWTVDGEEHTVSMRGESMDNASFQVLAEAAAARLEHRP